MAIGLNATGDYLRRSGIPSGGAGTLSQGGFSDFFVGVWVNRPVTADYATTAGGSIIHCQAGAREVLVGFNSAGSALADLNLQVIYNSGGGTGTPYFFPLHTGASFLGEWVYYFVYEDSSDDLVAGYIRLADLATAVTNSYANDNAGSQYVNDLTFGSDSSASAVVEGHYAFARAVASASLTAADVLAFAASDSAELGDWEFWPLPDNATLTGTTGNGRTLSSGGSLTSESSPSLATGVDVSPPLAVTVVASLDPSVATGALATPPLAITVVAAPDPAVATGALATPPLAVTVVAANDPAVTAGASVSPPLAVTVVAAGDPAVSTSALAAPPLAVTTVAAPDPAVAAGASVSPPLASTVVAAPDPIVGSTVVVQPPVAATAVAAPDPVVSAGVNVSPPLAITVALGLDPQVSTSALIVVPLARTVAAAPDPVVNTGMEVQVPTAVTHVFAHDPSIAAGASVQPPLAVTHVRAPDPVAHGGPEATLMSVELTMTSRSVGFSMTTRAIDFSWSI